MVEKLLTPKEVGEVLQISASSVLELIRRGRLRSIRVNSRIIRVQPQEIERYLKDWTPKEYKKLKEES